MHRKMPNYNPPNQRQYHRRRMQQHRGLQFNSRSGRWGEAARCGTCVHSMMPKLAASLGQSHGHDSTAEREERGGQLITRIPGLTVGAKVVSGDALQEILQRLFVARLLALAQCRGHGVRGCLGLSSDAEGSLLRDCSLVRVQVPLCDGRRFGGRASRSTRLPVPPRTGVQGARPGEGMLWAGGTPTQFIKSTAPAGNPAARNRGRSEIGCSRCRPVALHDFPGKATAKYKAAARSRSTCSTLQQSHSAVANFGRSEQLQRNPSLLLEPAAAQSGAVSAGDAVGYRSSGRKMSGRVRDRSGNPLKYYSTS